MKEPKYSDGAIVAALMKVEDGLPVQQLCWDLGISIKTFNTWRSRFVDIKRQADYGGIVAALLERIKELETQNLKLKKMRARKKAGA